MTSADMGKCSSGQYRQRHHGQDIRYIMATEQWLESCIVVDSLACTAAVIPLSTRTDQDSQITDENRSFNPHLQPRY